MLRETFVFSIHSHWDQVRGRLVRGDLRQHWLPTRVYFFDLVEWREQLQWLEAQAVKQGTFRVDVVQAVEHV